MKIFKLKILVVLSVIVTFFSCEKDITIDLPEAEEKIVVEGWIENNEHPKVILSRNSSYFSVINEATINHMFNVDAVVTVKEIETGTEEVLVKTFNPLFLPPVMYNGSVITGKINHHYLLTIEVDGKILTANTSIPDTIGVDSTYFEVEPPQDTLGPVWIMFQDPPQQGNYYRIFAKRLSKDTRFIPVWGSIYDDVLFNGEYIDYSFYRGVDRYAPSPEDFSAADFYFTFGDTIVTKFCVLDKAHYDFWKTYENAIYSDGNPFAAPATI